MNFKALIKSSSTISRIEDAEQVSMVELINQLIAEEFIQWYQYFSVYQFLAGTPNANEIADKFKEWADDELNDHATSLMKRLNELGMQFTLTTPETWSQQATALQVIAPVDDINSQLDLNKDSEMHAITRYQEAIKFAESVGDVTTADLFKHILADEEEHYSDILDFKQNLSTLNI